MKPFITVYRRLTILVIVGLVLFGRGASEPGFAQGRIRMDLVFAGNDQEQEVYLKGMQWDKQVSIPQKQHLPAFEYGEYQIQVLDSVSQEVLFRYGFSSLFFEWRTTLPAKDSETAYDQSVFIPAFAQPVLIRILERKKHLGNYVELGEWFLNMKKHRIPEQAASPYTHKKLVDHGPSDEKVDLVFLAEGYTRAEVDKLHKDVQRMVDALFQTEPYAGQSHQFNVWLVESFSAESGTTVPHAGVYKNTVFSSSFNALQMERYLMINDQTAVLKAVVGIPCDAVYVLVNTDRYGGGGIYNFYGMSASDGPKAPVVFIHEFGHSFAGLADEYFTSETTYDDFYSMSVEPWEPNITNFIQFDKKWKDLIPAKTPVPTPDEEAGKYPIGAYEGAAYMPKGMFRPAFDCRMRSNEAPGFCPACSHSILRMIRFYSK